MSEARPGRRRRELRDEHVRTFQLALAVGVRVAMGTDAGAYGHGHNAVEFRHLVEAGMTPLEAIVAGTGTAAACLGLAKDLGTLEPGKFADLLVVDGDPLADIGTLNRQERRLIVMKGGVIHVDRRGGPSGGPENGAPSVGP